MRFPFAVLLCILCISLGGFSPQADVELHVNNRHLLASDDNPGTVDQPLLTIDEAADRAVSNKRNYISTKVVVHPGTYREKVGMETYTNWPSNQPNNQTPMSFEAAVPGSVVISGSDVWSDWTRNPSTGIYEADWPHNWGMVPDPSGGARDVQDIMRRREIVFVDNIHLQQVMSLGDVRAGTYFVDEGADKLYMSPPNGTLNPQSIVEVGVREYLWRQEWEFNVTIKGFIFEKAATRWADAYAALRFYGGNNVRIEDATVQWNNGRGIYFTGTDDPSLIRVKMNDNGWDGWGTWKVRRFLSDGSETSYNNWRGHWGAFYGWSVGNKLLNTHGLILRNHKAIGNYARGLWLDLDNREVVFDNVQLIGNWNDAIFIEANPGPIEIKNSEFCYNDGYAIMAANSEKVTLENNLFCDNTDGGFLMTGRSAGRYVRNWQTNQSRRLFNAEWTIEQNSISAFGDGDLIETTLDTSGWNILWDDSSSDENGWCHLERPDVFDVPGSSTNLTFSAWQSATNQDQRSTFTCASLPVELADFRAETDGINTVLLQWRTETETDNSGFEVQQYAFNTQSWNTLGFVHGAGTTNDPQYYHFRVEDVVPGLQYFRLKQIDVDGTFAFSPQLEVSSAFFDDYHVEPAYPNPFDNQTNFSLTLAKAQNIDIRVFDIRGRQVQSLHTGVLEQGTAYRFQVDGTKLASGMYVVHINGEYFGAHVPVIRTR